MWVLGLVLSSSAHDVGVVARVGQRGSQWVIARHEAPLLVGGGEVLGVFPMELLCCLPGGEGDDVEGAHAAWGHELAAHLVGDDAHVEAEVDLDAGMQFEF